MPLTFTDTPLSHKPLARGIRCRARSLVASMFLLLLSISVAAQSEVDSLLNAIPKTKGKERIALTTALSQRYSRGHKNQSGQILQQIDYAIQLADSLGNAADMHKLYLNKGNIQQSIDLPEGALASYLKGIEVTDLPSFPDPQAGKAHAYNNIGTLYKKKGEIDKALGYYQKALAYQPDTNSTLPAILHSNLGEVYRLQNNFALALEHYQKSIRAYTVTGNAHLIDVPLENIGILYGMQGQHQKALEYLLQALEISKRNKDMKGICYSEVNVGDAYRQSGQYAKALYHLGEALAISKQMGYKFISAHALLYLSQTYTALGEHQKATRLLEQHIAYKDSILNEQNTAKIAELEAAYHFKDQQKEIALLKAQQGLKDAELKEQEHLMYALVGGILFFMILLFLIYKQYRLKKHSNTLLKRYNKEIKESNLHLEQMNQRLHKSQEELRQLNATKDKFFSILSHDLRSPMNSLAGMLEVISLSSASFSKEEMVQLTSRLHGSVKNLNGLLNNLLQWSMAQMGKLEYKPQQIELEKLVATNIALARLAADAKHISVSSSLEPHLEVKADWNMLDFVMRNLLSNAVKFTPQGGTISLTAEQKEEQVVLTVKDTGVGIPEENLKKLFKIGEHLSTEGTAKESGTGLGLILCKEFMERNGGTITAVSKLGEYTAFILALPAVSVSSQFRLTAAAS